EAPTLEALAARIATDAAPAMSLPTPVPATADACPLSFAQQRLWLLDQLGAGAAYNISGAVRLLGPLQREALSQSLVELARRHDALRTTFESVGDSAVQRIGTDPAFPLRVVELGGRDAREREEEARVLAGEEARRPFDLARGPLARAALFVIDEEDQ